MPPADRDKTPRKPRARKATPQKRRESETNGHAEWPDYQAQTTSWDPWDDGDGGAVGDLPGEGVNRTLGEWLEAVVPPEAQLHFFNAGREFAAGLQTTFDYHLNRGGDGDETAQALRIEIE